MRSADEAAPAPRIERACARLLSGDPVGALDALLASWRAQPRPAIADRVDTLSAWLAPALPPIDPTGGMQAAWLLRAGAGHAVDQPVLAATLATRPFTQVRERLTWLGAQAPDPRWTAPLLALMGDLLDRPRPTRAPTRAARHAADVLRRLGDRRAIERLRAQAHRMDGRAESWLRRMTAALPAEPPPLAAALLARLDAALAQATAAPPQPAACAAPSRRSDADLRALIYADPTDLDAYRIYADFLEATGAPRAEFLRLQLRRADGRRVLKKDLRREAQLIARHGLSWLGPLGPVVKQVGWHLGFPAAADVRFRRKAQRDALLAEPAWRTLTTLHTTDPVVLTHPNLAQVRQLGRAPAFVGTTERLTPMSIETLDALAAPIGATGLVTSAGALAELDLDRLPALDTLHLCDIDALGSAVAGWLSQLDARAWDRLVFWGLSTAVGFHLVRRFSGVRRVEVVDWGMRFGLTRRADGSHLDLVWAADFECRDFSQAIEVAEALAPQTVQIHTPGYNHPAPRLEAWRARLSAPEIILPRARRGT